MGTRHDFTTQKNTGFGSQPTYPGAVSQWVTREHKQKKEDEELHYINQTQSWLSHEEIEAMTEHFQSLNLSPEIYCPGFEDPDCPNLNGDFLDHEADLLTNEDIQEIMHVIIGNPANISFIKGFVDAAQPAEGDLVEKLRAKIKEDYAPVFAGKTGGNPPVRGIFGEAEIILKPDTVPVKQRAYQMVGESVGASSRRPSVK